jgi:hypothetical protein
MNKHFFLNETAPTLSSGRERAFWKDFTHTAWMLEFWGWGGMLDLRWGQDYYIGTILELYRKLGPWYFKLLLVRLNLCQL